MSQLLQAAGMTQIAVARQLGPKGVTLRREIAESVYLQYRRRPRNRIQEETDVTIVVAGAAGWLILLLMCAYAKARDRRF